MNMKVVVVSNQDKNQNDRKQNQDEGGGEKENGKENIDERGADR